jgi:hypothetical protein
MRNPKIAADAAARKIFTETLPSRPHRAAPQADYSMIFLHND